jgi:hypothetical protein
MKNNIFKKTILAVVAIALITACSKDLNLKPTNDITPDIAYNSLIGYKQVLAKVYGSYALTGNTGAGSSYLGGINAGFSDFLRLYWNLQELTSDEAACAWNDPGIPELNYQTWTSENLLNRGLYTRSLFQITIANEFLRESTDQKLASRGITGNDAMEVKKFRAEARFLRAYQYWVLMDMYGNPAFITENDQIGKVFPKQTNRIALFNYVETELKAIEPEMAAPKTNEYGRADRAAVWFLLARVYLNAEVYLGAGNAKNTEAITYATKVLTSGYFLLPAYKNLFLADNDKNNSEVILSINYDGIKTQNYGGTTFLINSSTNGAMNPTALGISSGGWGGNRLKQNIPLLFTDKTGATDKRAMFFGAKINMDDVSAFTDGLATTKFKNITSTGAVGPTKDNTLTSTDFPLMRLAEMNLTYAEAVLRGGGGGSQGQALTYFNALRTRAYENNTGNVTNISLQDILDEYGREFYWEARRRTDLIRFDKYTSDSYLWPFKGGVKAGKGTEGFRKLFPIPSADIISNPNLKQNPGY